MFTQFGRLLKRIAESNDKVFKGEPLKVHTVNQSQECQMAKLRVIKNESEQAPRRAPSPTGCGVQGALANQ
ncbi:hypothetical protein [Dethiobacter alkaliphilus]|uniref:hypothetical protein n=1 Tax=Dethiobacter alkaliphilus TaxID=427926 RepID=UPI0022270DCA|nr:hypothetical protein [Dethiobacter alkaliphilus]MCW3488854.1 hypothetical protein [Dethiobacter alkaliphilus]